MLGRIWIILLLQLSVVSLCQAQVTISSWNLRDFGKSKPDAVIRYIAAKVKDFDIVAIQEVVAGDGGAQAVARLSDELNRKGAKWDYTISDPTTGNSYKAERYAYLWKTKNVSKVGRAWLEKNYAVEIDREPYLCTFRTGGNTFTLVNFHAITKNKQPETEIKYFKYFPSAYPDLDLIFCGDFNCPSTHTVFNPLKSLGYMPALANQKTTLRQRCINDDCLASEFDNVFYNSQKILPLEAGVLHFYREFSTLGEAQSVSDHLPVFFRFKLK